ncbi:MAG: HEAT repeat domain-containing protein [Acidobacteria bacterium]|nr:HEAT repeat domain-containing protein [Acidobacteriota bacterium]
MEEIFQTNPDNEPILFDLIKKLEDKNNPFRCGAIFALIILGKEAKVAMPYLVEAVNDKDVSVRANAIFGLGEIGAESEIIIPIVIKALKDTESDVRYYAASLLYSDKLSLTPHQRKAIIPLLINALKEEWKLQELNQHNHHYLYAEALSKIGPEVIPYLINSLKDEDKSFRTCVIGILNRYDQKAEDAIPILMEMLADENKEVQYRAAFAIAGISDTKAKMVLPIIVEALRDKKFFIGASYAVRKLVPTAKEAIPILIDKLKEENTNKCSQETDFAIETLGIMGAQAKTAVPVLLDYMHTAYCTPTENKAAQALAKVAIEDETVIPILLNDLNKPNNHGVSQALAEVGKVKTKTILVALIEALKSEDSYVRINTANTLKFMGETAVDAIPALLESLKDEDSWVKFNAIDALGTMKEKAQVAIPSLINALTDENEYVRYSAADALGTMGEKAQLAIPALINNLNNGKSNDKSDDAKYIASIALGKIASNSSKVRQKIIPVLIDILNYSSRRDLQEQAAIILGNLGDDAKVAIPALKEALKSDGYGTFATNEVVKEVLQKLNAK